MSKVRDRIEDLKRIKEIRDKGELMCIPFSSKFPKLSNFIPGIIKGLLYKITAGCVDGNTQFMTETGWKDIREYEEGDKVLQYNEDGSTEFVDPINYINEPCNEMWSIKTKYGISQTLSDEHNVVYFSPNNLKLKTNTLSEIRTIHSLQKTGFRGLIKTSFKPPLRNGIDMEDDMIRLQVAVHADGHLHGRRVVFRLKKHSKKQNLRKLLLKCNTSPPAFS